MTRIKEKIREIKAKPKKVREIPYLGEEADNLLIDIYELDQMIKEFRENRNELKERLEKLVPYGKVFYSRKVNNLTMYRYYGHSTYLSVKDAKKYLSPEQFDLIATKHRNQYMKIAMAKPKAIK